MPDTATDNTRRNPWRLAKRRLERRHGRRVTWAEFAARIDVSAGHLRVLASPGQATNSLTLVLRAAAKTQGAVDVKECARWREKMIGAN